MRFFSAASSTSETWPKSFWTNIVWSFRKIFLLSPTFGTFSRDPDLKWKLKCRFRFRPGPFSSIHVSGLQKQRTVMLDGKRAPVRACCLLGTGPRFVATFPAGCCSPRRLRWQPNLHQPPKGHGWSLPTSVPNSPLILPQAGKFVQCFLWTPMCYPVVFTLSLTDPSRGDR